MDRNRFVIRRVLLLAGAILTLAWAGTVPAQGFPSKPLEFVVHTSPGGGTDVFGRIVTEIINRDKLLPQPVKVANRTGGGGTIAFSYIKSKRGDPHVVLTMATGSLLTAASRTDVQLGLENYTPLAFFALDPQVVAVPADSKIATFKDLVEAGRREPNTLVAAVTSAGGAARELLYIMDRDLGAKFKFVSFKSGSDAALSVVGGHVPFTTENLSEMYAQVEAKKLRVLAVTGEKRMSVLPNVPTLREAGLDATLGTGRGFGMPAGVPKEAAVAMEAVLKRVHDSPAWKEFASRNMFDDYYMGSTEFSQYLLKRREQMQAFLAYAGLLQKQ